VRAGLAGVFIAPNPVLIEPAEEFTTDSPFATRDELVANVGRSSGRIMQGLEDLAGDRWPEPARAH
jgi:hypothetical protein